MCYINKVLLTYLSARFVEYVQKQCCTFSVTTTFWKDFSQYISDRLVFDFSLLWRDELFGFRYNKRKKQKEMYLINLLIILGKYHIHKAKFSYSKPSCIAFGRETEQ